MAPAAKIKLRSLSEREFQELTRMAKATSERLDVVRRAKALLEVASGSSFSHAARSAGFRSGDGVALLVERFNQRGLAALEIASGRGPKPRYDQVARGKIIKTVGRSPDRIEDQTASWSLATLERSLRKTEPALPKIGATTIRRVLHQAGYRFVSSRSWCQTGVVKRKRKEGVVTVIDPRTEEKKG